VIIIPVLYPATDLPVIQKASLLHKFMTAAQIMAHVVNMHSTKYVEGTKKH